MCQSCGCSSCKVCGAPIEDGVCSGCGESPKYCICGQQEYEEQEELEDEEFEEEYEEEDEEDYEDQEDENY